MNLPVIIIGGGGHARVLIDTLLNNSVSIIGITDPEPGKTGSRILGISVLGNDEILQQYSVKTVQLVNGVGATDSTARRRLIYESFKDRGYTFATVVHRSAFIARNVLLNEGVQIMAGAVIQTGSIIGKNTIINTRATIDHDCRIEDHSHLAPGATLCGGVEVGEGAFIGSSATLIQNVKIGRMAFIGAGAVVVKDIPPDTIAMGIPAQVT